MSQSAADIYASHLSDILGEEGVFTEVAVYAPGGEDERTLFGIFEENTFRARGTKRVAQEPVSGARFLICEKLDFDIYRDKVLRLERTGKEYIIQYQDTDEKGAQVLWLL